MIVLSAHEVLTVDTTWFDSATNMTVSGSELTGTPGGTVYMSGVFTVSGTVVTATAAHTDLIVKES